jgi:hypothetical protein
MTRRPDPGAFLRSRLERGTFVRLLLTILAAPFILVAVS